MKKIKLCGIPAAFEKGLQALLPELGVSLSAEGTPLEVCYGHDLTVTVKNGKAIIECESKTAFFRGLSLAVQHLESGCAIRETNCFDKNGIMFDCSRNAVLTIDALKGFLRKMALMGLNLGMMYTADTYTVPERPYFGYLRGRYSFEELKELDDYADMLGIELMPCIQTLAHLERVLHWPANDYLRDTEQTLMVGADETYLFIEQMLKAATAPYRSNRVHIGMDEAWNLGRGRYMNINGYQPVVELMAEHLRRVSEVISRLGLKAMMWSDMHFMAASKNHQMYEPDVQFSQKNLDGAPKDIGLVYWDYYHKEESHYDSILKKHEEFQTETVFAGGIWTWTGPSADYRKTVEATVPALTQCIKHNVRQVFATAWGDDGAETNLQTILYGLQIYAEFGWTGGYDEDWVNARFRACVNADPEAFLSLSDFSYLPEMPLPENGVFNLDRLLMLEDPLMPIFEEDLKGLSCQSRFEDLETHYSKYREQNPAYADLFHFYACLAGLLTQKCIWRNSAAACVRSKDLAGAEKLLAQADVVIEKLHILTDAWRTLWFSTNKPYGYEVIDIRMGGQIARFESAKLRMADFAAGRIDDIPELSEPKLPFVMRGGKLECMNDWANMSSACRIIGL